VKHVVSVSTGSSARDKRVEVELLGEKFLIERRGTDGDFRRAAELIAELDGEVDAIGLGGVDLYVYCAGRRYVWRSSQKLASRARKTPVVDGSGLKNTLERMTVQYIAEHNIVPLRGTPALVVCAVDRFGMAEALYDAGCDLRMGDVAWALGVPVLIRSWWTLKLLARTLLPILTRLPQEWFYPSGERQRAITPKFEKFYRWAKIIAGDFHFIRRYMPDDLAGKVILTQTITEDDIAELKKRRVHLLITSTPEFDGRSFGTNVMEAVVLTLLGKRPEEATPEEYLEVLGKLGWRPRVTELCPQAGGGG